MFISYSCVTLSCDTVYYMFVYCSSDVGIMLAAAAAGEYPGPLHVSAKLCCCCCVLVPYTCSVACYFCFFSVAMNFYVTNV